MIINNREISLTKCDIDVYWTSSIDIFILTVQKGLMYVFASWNASTNTGPR